MSDDQSPRKKYRSSAKRFQDQWFDHNPSWKQWVEKVPEDECKFRCIPCNTKFIGGQSEIKKHSETLKHKQNFQIFEPETSTSTSFALEDGFDYKDKIKCAEILFATVAAELNLPFCSMDRLLKTFQFIGKDSNVLQAMNMNEKKMSGIINNVLCPVETSRITDVLRVNKFSVYVDETSDDTNEKWLSIMVRYVHPVSLHIKNELLELLCLDASDCSADKLYDAFKNSFLKKEISIKNIMGIGCDNASVMMAHKSSFKTKIKNDNIHVQVISCVCHSLALALNNGAKKAIPQQVEYFIKGIASYIKNSPKRTAIFKDLQMAFREKPLKILRYSETRWLSRFQCIDRILSQWDILLTFFDGQNDRSDNYKFIIDNLRDPKTKGYLMFMHYVLDKFNKLNEHFQCRASVIQDLQPLCREILVWICHNFLKKALLENNIFNNIRKINLLNSSNQLPLNEVELGFDCEEHLNTHDAIKTQDFNVEEFRKNCLNFYIYTAEKMIELLPFDDPFLKNITVFRYEDAILNSDRNDTFIKVSYVAEKCGYSAHINSLKEEWYSLYNLETALKDKYCALSFDDMWMHIGLLKINDEIVFPNLQILLNTIRCLPHSNAEAERAFSLITDIKSKKRNSLSTKTLNSLCVTKWALKANCPNPNSYNITRQHLELMNTSNLYQNATKQNVTVHGN